MPLLMQPYLQLASLTLSMGHWLIWHPLEGQALLLRVTAELFRSQPALMFGVILPPKKDSQILLVKLHEASIAKSESFSRSPWREALF